MQETQNTSTKALPVQKDGDGRENINWGENEAPSKTGTETMMKNSNGIGTKEPQINGLSPGNMRRGNSVPQLTELQLKPRKVDQSSLEPQNNGLSSENMRRGNPVPQLTELQLKPRKVDQSSLEPQNNGLSPGNMRRGKSVPRLTEPQLKPRKVDQSSLEPQNNELSPGNMKRGKSVPQLTEPQLKPRKVDQSSLEPQNNGLSPGNMRRGKSVPQLTEPQLKPRKVDQFSSKLQNNGLSPGNMKRGNSVPQLTEPQLTEPQLKPRRVDQFSLNKSASLSTIGKKSVHFSDAQRSLGRRPTLPSVSEKKGMKLSDSQTQSVRQMITPPIQSSKMLVDQSASSQTQSVRQMITPPIQSSKMLVDQSASSQTQPVRRKITPPVQSSKQPVDKIKDSQTQPVRKKITPPMQSSKIPINQFQKMNPLDDVYDVLIIGGGVVGAAVLRAATLSGYKTILVESESDLLTGASSGNSGIVCTGVDTAPGSLERALIRDSISQIRHFLKRHRIPHRACGSLVCQWDWDQVGRDKNYTSPLSRVLAQSIDAGDTHASRLNPGELREAEPNISPHCKGAVHIPGEIVLDPWIYSIAMVAHARENGARIITNFEVESEKAHFDTRQRVWTIRRKVNANEPIKQNAPLSLRAKAIVNATGVMTDLVQSGTPCVYPPHWKSMPRRGQYKIFQADQSTYVTHPIQPVPTQRTKGVFVYSTLYDQIVVGPTAEEQKSRVDRTPNPQCSDYLTSTALRILPDLDPVFQYVGEYVGIRSATNFRDYQISMTAESRWVAAAGIRSTGLTASLGIGRHIVDLLRSVLPFPKPLTSIRTTPLPDLKRMVDQFNTSEEGYVLIHGFLYKVTHPLTRFGFQARSGIAEERKRRVSSN